MLFFYVIIILLVFGMISKEMDKNFFVMVKIENNKKKLDWNKIFSLFDKIIYLFLGGFFALDFFINFNVDKSFLVQISFLTVGIMSFYAYLKDNRFISIHKIICIFLFLFMFYTPFHQYLVNKSFWSMKQYDDSIYLIANCITNMFTLIYLIIYLKNRKKVKNKESVFNKELKVNKVGLSLMSIICLGVVCFLYLKGELFSALSAENDVGSLYIAFLKIIRYIPVSAFVFCALAYKYKMFTGKLFTSILFGLFILIGFGIVYFPLNGALNRYLLFGAYLTIGSIIFKDMKCNSLVPLAFFIGFGLVFPAFNFFKTHSLSEISQFELGGFDPNTNDYDAHYLLMTSIEYVKMNGVLGGDNIMSAILSFVPRSIFVTKLEHSGEILGTFFGATYANLSCAIMAEFYLAFHLSGVVLGTIIFSTTISFLEKNYNKGNIILDGIYVIVLGLMMVIMRGALLPFVSYFICMCVSFVGICVVILLTQKNFYKKLLHKTK